MGKSTRRQECFAKLYSDVKTAHWFIKTIIQSIGMNMRTTNKRIRGGTNNRNLSICEIYLEPLYIALLFAQKNKFRDPLLEYLPTLMATLNFCDATKEVIIDGIEMYNECVKDDSSCVRYVLPQVQSN